MAKRDGAAEIEVTPAMMWELTERLRDIAGSSAELQAQVAIETLAKLGVPLTQAPV